MSCCGQKRQQWQQRKTYEGQTPVAPTPILENAVTLQYKGTSTYLIKGPSTGYLYLFAANEPGLLVDGRDASMILKESENFSMAGL
jgi:hypothetical protein